MNSPAPTALVLTGFSDSVYSWAARLGLRACGREFGWHEVNPFEPGGQANPHPFGQVPVLQHGAFTLYETAAILLYVDDLAEGPGIVPEDMQARARMHQVLSIINGHVYRPLVRQVYSHGVYRPRHGEAADPQAMREGLAASESVLDVLDGIAGEGLVLRPDAVEAGSVLLLPMLVTFGAHPEAREMLRARAALWDWLRAMSARDIVRKSCPEDLREDLVA